MAVGCFEVTVVLECFSCCLLTRILNILERYWHCGVLHTGQRTGIEGMMHISHESFLYFPTCADSLMQMSRVCLLELAQGTGLLANGIAVLGSSEEHTTLARALAQLAEVQEHCDSVHVDQAHADIFVFAELIHEYIGLVQAVKVCCFTSLILKIYLIVMAVDSHGPRRPDQLFC